MTGAIWQSAVPALPPVQYSTEQYIAGGGALQTLGSGVLLMLLRSASGGLIGWAVMSFPQLSSPLANAHKALSAPSTQLYSEIHAFVL